MSQHATRRNAVLETYVAYVAFVAGCMSYLAKVKALQQTQEPAPLPAPLPPVTLRGTPLASARRRLEEYRATYGAQNKQGWQEHLKRAIEAVRATFPPDRRPYALTHYFKSYGDDTPQALAAHVIALELWAADKRQRQNGVWLDAAYQAVGLEPDALAGGAGEAARPNTPWEELI